MNKHTSKIDPVDVISLIPEPALLLSNHQGSFLIEAVNESFQKRWEIKLQNNHSKELIELLNELETFNQEREHVYLKNQLDVCFNKKSFETSDVLELNSSPDSGKTYIQFASWPFLYNGGKKKYLVLAIRDVTEVVQRGLKYRNEVTGGQSKIELEDKNEDLRQIADKNRAQFESASNELDDFVYSVSHDLRAPLRRIDGFSQELIENYLENLDETGQHYLRRVRQGAQDMGNLIDELLKLSRISRRKVERKPVDLSELAKEVFQELTSEITDRSIRFDCDKNLDTEADPGLLKIVLSNLLSNALKYTRKKEKTIIEVGSYSTNGSTVFYIKDNGAGFDMDYSEKLFKAFQRLHSQHEFDGTGIGLVTVKRIVTSHGGEIWADSKIGEGAVFYFTLQ